MAKYKVIGELGRGGMGVVYRALQVDLNREVAMKVLNDESLSKDRRRVRFEREIEVCIGLQHPNIIKIFDYGEFQGNLFYTMELLKAKALIELIEDEGPQPPSKILRIIAQVADALGYCHSRGLIHRDVKPHNIMLKEDGLAVLMDFGLNRSEMKTAVTEQGALVGTPRFLAPEVILGDDASPGSDIYALGLTGYELAVGRPAFNDYGDFKQLLMGIVKNPLPPILDTVPGFPADVEEFLSTMIDKEPGRRIDARTSWRKARALLERHDPASFTSIDGVRTYFHVSGGISLDGLSGDDRVATPSSSSGTLRRPTRRTGRITSRVVSIAPPPRRPWVPGLLVGLGLVAVGTAFVTLLEPGGSMTAPVPPLRVVGLDVIPLTWRRAEVRVTFDPPRPPVPVLHRITDGAAGVPTTGTVRGDGILVLDGLEPGGTRTIRLECEGSLLPGGEKTYRHPVPVSFFRSTFDTGEDYARLWFETPEPHRMEMALADGTGNVIHLERMDQPSRSWWKVVRGLKPATAYELRITDLDPDHFLMNPRRRVETKGPEYRAAVNQALSRLGLPLMNIAAAGELYSLQDVKTVDRIVSELQSPELRERDGIHQYKFLINTLGEILVPSTLDPFLELVEHAPSPEHEAEAIKAISYMGGIVPFERIQAVIRKRAKRHGDDIEAYKTGWRTGEALVSIDAARAARYADEVSREAGQRPVEERVVATSALIGVREPVRAGALGRLARQDPDWRIRNLAVSFLGRIGDEEALDELSATLAAFPEKDGDSRLLATLLLALGVAGRSGTGALLVPWLDPSRPVPVRRAAVIGLGLLRDSGSLPSLMAALARPDPELRPFVVWSVGKFGEAAREALPLLAGLVSEAGASGGQLPLALARIGGTGSAPALAVVAARTGDAPAIVEDRAGAWVALGLIGEESARDGMMATIASGSRYERGMALVGLALLGGAQAIQAVNRVARDDREDLLVRALAVRCRGLLGGIALRNDLESFLKGGKAPEPVRSAVAQVRDHSHPDIRDGQVHIVPAFLPFERTSYRLAIGDHYHTLSCGLWSPAPGDDRLCDENGTGLSYTYRAPPMTLVAMAGANSRRIPTQGLGAFYWVAEGEILLAVNHPPPGDDPVFDHLPDVQVRPDAYGFVLVFFRKR